MTTGSFGPTKSVAAQLRIVEARPPPKTEVHVLAAIEGAKPLSMNGYKLGLTRTVVKRALLAAVGDRYWEKG